MFQLPARAEIYVCCLLGHRAQGRLRRRNPPSKNVSRGSKSLNIVQPSQSASCFSSRRSNPMHDVGGSLTSVHSVRTCSLRCAVCVFFRPLLVRASFGTGEPPRACEDVSGSGSSMRLPSARGGPLCRSPSGEAPSLSPAGGPCCTFAYCVGARGIAPSMTPACTANGAGSAVSASPPCTNCHRRCGPTCVETRTELEPYPRMLSGAWDGLQTVVMRRGPGLAAVQPWPHVLWQWRCQLRSIIRFAPRTLSPAPSDSRPRLRPWGRGAPD